MMIHTRANNPEAWQAYKDAVRAGKVFEPIARNFRRFCAQTLGRRSEGVPHLLGPPRERTLLDDIR